MNTKYIIRQTSFMYNDEYFYTWRGFGNFIKEYSDKEEATAALLVLEQKALSGLMVGDYEPISVCHDDNGAKLRLNDYLQSEFGITLFDENSPHGDYFVERDFTLPNNLTLEQTKHIREATGLKLHCLIEITTESPGIWGIQYGKNTKKAGEWAKYDAVRVMNGNYESKEIPKVYDLELDAHDELANELRQCINNRVFSDVKDLSETPGLLKSFIEQNSKITYDEENDTIQIQYLNNEDLNVFHGLLKEKMLTVKPFPLDKILEYGGGWEPEM